MNHPLERQCVIPAQAGIQCASALSIVKCRTSPNSIQVEGTALPSTIMLGTVRLPTALARTGFPPARE
ncbi:hypothetical protein AAKU67_004260 [Oxalobacteraceae bacterium GrIS 2.11]